MKLHLKLQKVIGLTVATTTLFACTPMVAWASDYTGHWAEAAIHEWQANGVINGYADGSFRPKQAVTRAEFAKMLVEVFGLTYTEGVEQFEDVAADKWYTAPIQAAAAAGLMVGTEEGNFRPHEQMTREEAAYAVAAAYHITGESAVTYKDQASISEWAVPAVEALTANGYMDGYLEDGTFRPQGILTRAEAVTLLDKMTAVIIQDAGMDTQDIQGNLVVNTPDVVLKDKTIDGNLYLAEGMGEGTITLDNVKVTGQIMIAGGAKVKLVETTLGDVYIHKATGPVSVVADAASEMLNVVVDSAAQLQGKMRSVAIATPDAVQLVKADIAALAISAEGAKVDLDSFSVVDTLVVDAKAELSGHGVIKAAQINADEVSFAHQAPEQIVVAPEISHPSVPPTNGGGSSSGGSTSRPDTVTVQSVSIVAPPAEVTTGSSIYLAAEVQVTPDKPEYKGVNWSLKDGAPAGCTLTEEGVFCAGTTTGSAIIVATSTQDPSQYDEVAIQVVEQEEQKPAVEVIGMSLVEPPTQVTYKVGEALDLTGLSIELIMSDGTSEVVSEKDFTARGIMTTPAKGTRLEVSDEQVEIRHQASGQSISQAITVKAPEIVTIKDVKVGTNAPDQALVTFTIDQMIDLKLGSKDNIVIEAINQATGASLKIKNKTWTDYLNAVDGTQLGRGEVVPAGTYSTVFSATQLKGIAPQDVLIQITVTKEGVTTTAEGRM